MILSKKVMAWSAKLSIFIGFILTCLLCSSSEIVWHIWLLSNTDQQDTFLLIFTYFFRDEVDISYVFLSDFTWMSKVGIIQFPGSNYLPKVKFRCFGTLNCLPHPLEGNNLICKALSQDCLLMWPLDLSISKDCQPPHGCHYSPSVIQKNLRSGAVLIGSS